MKTFHLTKVFIKKKQMRRNLILKLARINGRITNYNHPNGVYRGLLRKKELIGIPLTEMEMAMISYLSLAFKFNEDINVLYNYIENNLFMIKFDVISELGSDIDCDVCEGSSKVECVACDGTGDDEVEDECYNCDGTGEVDCDTCYGDGYVFDENAVFKDVVTCFSYDRNYFNMFELNTSGFISSSDYDIFLEDEKTIFIITQFGELDRFTYQFDREVGQSFILDLIKL
jgi:hypothetical protein